MPKIIIGHIILILLLISCKNKEKVEQDAAAINEEILSTIKSDKPITNLNNKAKDLVKTWPEYQNFNDLINQYQEITVSEALLNSVELSELAKQLRDSIRVDKLNIPEVKIRLNVLYSETLRLADMSSIPTISQESVEQENNNMIDAFSALNLKINNMNLQDELNSEISKFIDEVLESPTIDSSNTMVIIDSL
jgi:hypothetical protein